MSSVIDNFKPNMTSVFDSLIWITPTYVGKTSAYYPVLESEINHPHLRGENLYPTECIVTEEGSPPLTWGKPDAAFGIPLPAGITPTYVGKTIRCRYAC